MCFGDQHRLVQDIDNLERKEQHAHQSFTNWKQEYDAKTRQQAALAMTEAARKQMLWEKREMESDKAQKQAFAAWLKQKSQPQGNQLPRRRRDPDSSMWVTGATDTSMPKLKNGADATKGLYLNLDVDPVSEQSLLDAIKRGVVIGSHREPLLRQLYRKYQKEWGWDGSALNEANRRSFIFGGIEENCCGGIREGFVKDSTPHLPQVKPAISVATRSAGV
jgi:hypothetical protein